LPCSCQKKLFDKQLRHAVSRDLPRHISSYK
jgi:hypothetical protein